MPSVRRSLRVLVSAVGATAAVGLAVQVRRTVRATTMDPDYAAYWRRRRRSPGDVLFVALGDSLAQGMGSMRPELSWAGRLADHLEAVHGRPVRVLNLSVTGAGTADVARDQLPAIPPEAFTDPSSVVALAVGTNDAVGSEPEQFRREFAALCAALPAGALVADVPDFQRGPDRAAGARLSAIAREVVAGFPALRPVALYDATHGLRPWEIGPDFAHPSGLGYRRFGRAFVAALERPGPERRAPSRD